MPSMGLGQFADPTICIKRKFRWMFTVDGFISGVDTIEALPPMKAGRPQLSFKEFAAEHLNETTSWPMKPEWKPVQITLFDLKRSSHPMFKWFRQGLYNPESGGWSPPLDEPNFKKQGLLQLFDSCGEVIEEWQFDNMWPQDVNFGDLDFGVSEIVTCDVTFRYDRAFIPA